MATTTQEVKRITVNRAQFNLSQIFPFMDWLFHYRRENLVGDVMAGIIVMVMLVPQGMAYAMLAGLPPEVGLYASITPLIIYGLLGSSRTLAVGPVAMVSLLVATGIGQFAESGTGSYLSLALTLALMVGGIQFFMGLVRVGFLVNFLSHPVLSGFTNAAAFIIAISQIKHALGFSIPRHEYTHETVLYALEHLSSTSGITLGITLGSMAILFYFKKGLADHLKKLNMQDGLVSTLTKTGPLVVVVFGTLLVIGFNLHESANVAIVGDVPAGLPPLSAPDFHLDNMLKLLPVALTISLVGFMESITVAKSLASKRREKIHANQELVALGAANIGTAFTGGFPVTGGLSRSMVNFSAGANTGLASIITAILIILVALFLTPLFYYLPSAVLAAIILIAVSGLLDMRPLKQAWRYDKSDALALIITFLTVLLLGIETGILIGVASALALHLWRTSRPHIAIVGRIEDTEHYRNILRYETQTHPDILAIRVDESLYFANAQYLESTLLNTLAEHPEVDHLVLVCSGVNTIDLSALETLENLITELESEKVTLYLAEVKGPVMDRLKSIGFVDEIGEEHIFLTAHQAIKTLSEKA